MPNLSISQINVGNRIRFEVGNIEELAEDIRQYGLLHPLVVTAELVIFVQQLGVIISYYQELALQLNQTQESEMNELAMEGNGCLA
ncbi:MAG: hypothetical protein N3A72_09985 [bacterium]|nr:hypothetical protein [bacterium]